METMRAFRRLNIGEQHAGIHTFLFDIFDRALVTSYGTFLKRKLKLETWWGVHRDIASLVVDVDKVDALISLKGPWLTAEAILSQVTSTSQLGSLMYGWAHTNVIGDKMAVALKRLMATLSRSVSLSEIAWREGLKQFEQEALRLDARKTLLMHRDVTFKYCGLSLKLKMHSLDEEVVFTKAAWIKSQAMGWYLDPLPFEEHAVEQTKSKRVIESEMLTQYQAARCAAKSILAEVEMSGAVHLDVMKANMSLLTSVDATFALEISAAEQLQGQVGKDLMYQKILGCLPPTAAEHWSVDVAISNASELRGGNFYAMSSKESKVALDGFLSMLRKMATGVSPTQSILDSSPFMKEVAD